MPQGSDSKMFAPDRSIPVWPPFHGLVVPIGQKTVLRIQYHRVNGLAVWLPGSFDGDWKAAIVPRRSLVESAAILPANVAHRICNKKIEAERRIHGFGRSPRRGQQGKFPHGSVTLEFLLPEGRALNVNRIANL